MNTFFSIRDVFSTIIPGTLTCCSCLWFFSKYIRQRLKPVAFTMVLILALSDFIYSMTSLATLFFPNVQWARLYHNTFFISTHFSIFWASAMSFLVYRSVKGKDFNSNKLIIQTAIVVLVFQCILAMLWDPFAHPLGESLVVLVIPLSLALTFAFVFYWKSIKIMKSQSEYEQKSTIKFIRILQSYSLAQLVTYGPSIFFLCYVSGITYFESDTMMIIVDASAGIANLAGFINIMIFLYQGSMSYDNRVSIDQLDLDLTKDV